MDMIHARGQAEFMPQPATVSRVRRFAWSDPRLAAERGRKQSGLDYLRSIATGEAPQPPIGLALGFSLVEADYGRAVFALTPDEYHYNPIGTVHGGLAAVLIDSASGCAVYSTLDAGVQWTTLQMSIDYLKGMNDAVGPVRCEGRVVRVGRRVGVADAEVVGTDGTVFARGSTTCMILG
jgi:uncharacterized protein (TIGR00369 family)